jgi:hypothetical protein
MLYENLNYDGLNASLFWYGSSKEKITYISEHLYSTMCGLQTWVLGFFYPEDHDEQ